VANKLVLTIDMDGVVSKFDHGFVKLINRVYPEKNLPEDFEPRDWGYSDVLKPEEFGALWEELKDTKNFWQNLQQYPENTRPLAYFLDETKRDCNVYYVTSRMDTKGGTALVQTKNWLRARSLFLDNCSLIVVHAAKHKNAMLHGLASQFSIDDYLPTVVSAHTIPNHEAWLMSRPWNEEGRPEGIKVAGVFTDYLNIILRRLNS
jgi:5'(3')-deoxyribonucleotidase